MRDEPQKEKHSVFLISDTSQYRDIEENNKEIDYQGTASDKRINERFYKIATNTPPELIKVYIKYETNKWALKGFYRLMGAIVKDGVYRFRLVPV